MDANGNKTQNRLYHLQDASLSNAVGELTDMGAFTAGGLINGANNYVYDQEGRLIKDVQEEIGNITWRVDEESFPVERVKTSISQPMVALRYEVNKKHRKITK